MVHARNVVVEILHIGCNSKKPVIASKEQARVRNKMKLPVTARVVAALIGIAILVEVGGRGVGFILFVFVIYLECTLYAPIVILVPREVNASRLDVGNSCSLPCGSSGRP